MTIQRVAGWWEGSMIEIGEWTHKGGRNGVSLVISNVCPTLQGICVICLIVLNLDRT